MKDKLNTSQQRCTAHNQPPLVNNSVARVPAWSVKSKAGYVCVHTTSPSTANDLSSRFLNRCPASKNPIVFKAWIILGVIPGYQRGKRRLTPGPWIYETNRTARAGITLSSVLQRCGNIQNFKQIYVHDLFVTRSLSTHHLDYFSGLFQT